MRFRSAVLWTIVLLAAAHDAGGQEAVPSISDISSSLGKQDYDAALSRTAILLKQKPEDARLWVARGLALRGLQRTAESLESFQRALLLRPGNLVALQGAAEAAYTLDDPSAKKFVGQILAADPANPVANAMAGSLAYEAGDCKSAMTFFQAAPGVLERNTVASLQFSHCLVLNAEAARAVVILEPLKDRDHQDLVAFDLASAQYYAGKFDQSAATLEQLQKQNVDTAQLWNLLGADYDKLDRAPAALEAYRKACEKAPDTPGYYIDLARFAMEHSSVDAAVRILNAAIDRIPKSAALLTVRGSVYSVQGDATKAEADFTLAETVDPGSGYGRVGKSLLLNDQGKSSDAELLLRAELKKDPSDKEVEFFLAETLLRTPTSANNEEAERLLKDVLKDRPNDSNVLLALSKTHLAKHENQAALTLLQHARELDGDSAPILNRLLQTYRALGMKQQSADVAAQLRNVIDENRDAELRRNRFQITAGSRQDAGSNND